MRTNSFLCKASILHRVEKLKSGCWIWKGTINNRGYGQLGVRGKIIRAHRASLHLWKGFDLNSRLFVCHKCNMPLCVNPEHLYAGTPSNNAQDALKIKSNWLPNKGERSAVAKLTYAEVDEIKLRYSSGEMQITLADKFNVSPNTIWRAVNNVCYKEEFR